MSLTIYSKFIIIIKRFFLLCSFLYFERKKKFKQIEIYNLKCLSAATTTTTTKMNNISIIFNICFFHS